MLKIEIELDCDYDTAYRIKRLIDNLLENNINDRPQLLKGAKTTVKTS